MAKSHKWTFKARFRAKAYGWRGTALASKRLKEAVREIQKIAKSDPVLAADGAVALMERLWASLQAIDTSSGTLGAAVNRTLDALIPLLIDAPADRKTRAKWLDRLYEAVLEDGVEYLMPVQVRWGDICGCAELANYWADQMLPLVRDCWSRHELGAWVDGATLCLSCLVRAERYAELEGLLSLQRHPFWHFDMFQAEALARQGRTEEAIRYAEDHRRDVYQGDRYPIASFCERVLLRAGRREEAYRRYGLIASAATTNLAAFRKIRVIGRVRTDR